MPFQSKCPDHPEASVTYPHEILVHAAADHPNEPTQAVSDRITHTFVSQVHAQGNDAVHVVHCRACARPTEFRIAPGQSAADLPEKCEACR